MEERNECKSFLFLYLGAVFDPCQEFIAGIYQIYELLFVFVTFWDLVKNLMIVHRGLNNIVSQNQNKRVWQKTRTLSKYL